MKFWILAPWVSAEELAELAVLAQQLGFHGMMGADHAFIPRKMAALYPYTADGKPYISGEMYYPDAMITSAAMLMKTSTLQVSTAVYILPLRHPVEVAHMSSTLAQISGNRFVLSIGVGWMREEFEVMSVDYHSRGRRTDEAIEVLRKIWQGGYVSHEGEFFNFDQIQQAPAPSQMIPIYVGGSSKAALKRAARVGDGWIGTGHTLRELHDLLQQLGELRVEFNRQSVPFEIIGTPSEAPGFEELRAFQDKGMTAVSFGFAYSPDSNSQAGRKKAMTAYSNKVIKPWRRRFG